MTATNIDTAKIEALLRSAEAAHAKLEITTAPHDWVSFYAQHIMDELAAEQDREFRVSEAAAMFRATTLALI